MNASQLKASILQLAVQGRLVPQIASDEPASALLDRIREEKDRLIAEGKIKKEKTPSRIYRGDDGHFYEQIGSAAPVCIDDELPFEIPESWEWVRLATLFQIINGDRGKNYPAKDTLQVKGNIPFISAVNISNYTINEDGLLYL